MSDLIDRQAAIKAVDDLPNCYNGYSDAYDKSCIIGLLEELPSAQPDVPDTNVGDTISRQSAIEAVLHHGEIENNYTDLYYDGYCDGVYDSADMIKDLPSANQWIPCSERLPEDGTWNIFTDGKRISIERYKFDIISHFWPEPRWFDLEDAIAWMPLPDPWKGEEDA